MFFRILIFLVFLTFSFAIPQVNAEKGNLSQPIPDKFIVQFVDSPEERHSVADRLAKKYGFNILRVFDHSFRGAHIFVPNGNEKDIISDPEIKKLVQDFTVYAHGKALPAGQIIPNGVNRIDAELNSSNNGGGIKVAVLDTGIDFDHPDLSVEILRNKDFSGDDTQGNDNNNDALLGHGTHVAGIISALNNDIGVVGVAPGAVLVPVKILDKTGVGSIGALIAGIDYVSCLVNEINIANVSLGALGGKNPSAEFLETSELLHEAVKEATHKGIILIASSGNDGVDITTNNVIPAMYPEVITVSALDDRDGKPGNDRWASFSNYGQEVDIIAPGVKILSTSNDGSVSTLSGTSFAAAHVTGTIALYIAKNGRPKIADADFLSSLIAAISKHRSKLSGEPSDGLIEPLCFANGTNLQ